MSQPESRSVRRHFRLFWGAYVVLLCSIAATYLVFRWSSTELHNRQLSSFYQAQNKFRQVMDLHFSSYFNILNGVKGFCMQNQTLLPMEFNQYFDALGMRQNHLGIFDIGYIGRIRPSEREKILANAAKFGMPLQNLAEFPTDSEEHYALLYWDDFSPHPPLSYCSYVYDDPQRLAAMEKARDVNEFVSTERLDIHLGGNKSATNGFIIFLPVYAQGAPVETVEQRREGLVGFVFASFFIPDCWGKIYAAAGEPLIDFEVYDGRIPQADKLWFDGDGLARMALNASSKTSPQFKTSQTVGGIGREWTICYGSRLEFENTPELRIPKLIFASGVALSGVLFALSLIQVRARIRTEALAEELRSTSLILRQEKERLSVTLGSINEAVITVDSDSRVMLMNRVAEMQTGRALAQAAGERLDSLVTIEDAQSSERIAWPINEIQRTGKAWQTPKAARMRIKDAAPLLVTVTGSPMRAIGGGIEGVVVVIRDVTERQKLLEEQIKTSKLESVGVLAGGIAHDFNNILTTIVGNVSMAKLEAGQQTELADFLNEAELGCERARELTQQLLTFAKGGAPIRKAAILTEVIRDTARFATHGSSVRCDYMLASDLWLVDADTGQISQVIHNIVLNATQAMAGGGIIDVSAENHRIESRNDLGLTSGRYIKIAIQDHGIGIRPDHLARIFDPYFSTKQRGSGLGLATAYSIVRRHDGAITVSSELGKGTRFDIYLPASEKSAIEFVASEKAQPLVGKGWILIMDDERSVLNVLTKMLEKLGYDVISAMDGEEAVRLYSQAAEQGKSISAVILDLTVPGGVGGQQAITQLLAINPQVKGIVSSGYSNDPVMANYRDYGFQAVVPKPYRLDTLTAALAQLLCK